MSNYQDEELLHGGNVSSVFRTGNTVRRELKSSSTKVHKLLLHLERKGFDYSPKFKGIDEKGREIVSYIEGEAGNYPVKEYMWSDDALKEIATMLRCYHDAVNDFSFDNDWKPLDNTPHPLEVICHNDFAIYNIIFQHERPVGIIDFDVAAPGPRIWDIAYTLYTCAPLSRFHVTETGTNVSYNPEADAERIKQRIKLFFDAYGEVVAEDLLEMVKLRLEGLCKTIVRRAAEGDEAFQKMIEEGHIQHYEKDIQFISEHGNEWV